MPIPPEFKSQYKNEEQFTDGFLVPLLNRMGFSLVVNYHGTQEFGKDLVFAEVNQFGHVTYHGLQAKYVGSLSQGESHGLVNDANEAFNNPFTHPNTGAKEHINTFYVANGGNIAENARQHFFSSLRVPHGGRVRLLDAKALIALDRTAAMRKMELVSETLFGLQLECASNLRQCDTMQPLLIAKAKDALKPLPSNRFRTLALGSYLVHPITFEGLSVDVVHDVWHKCDTANRWLDLASGFTPEESRARLVNSLVETNQQIQPKLREILVSIGKVVNNLKPLAIV